MERLSRGDGANVTEQREPWTGHDKLSLSSSRKCSHGARVNAPSSVRFERASEASYTGSGQLRWEWVGIRWDGNVSVEEDASPVNIAER